MNYLRIDKITLSMLNTIIKEGEKLLSQGLIGKALEFIANEAKNTGYQKISDKAQKLLTDFNYMLIYFERGAQDPTRPEMLAHLYDETYNLLTLFFVKATEKVEQPRISEIPLDETEDLFDAIENNFPPTKDDRNRIHQIIMDDNNPLYLRAMVLSALTINLMKFFDNEKFENLYTYTLDDQPLVIRQRAWVAIVLITMAHDYRISTQPRLVEQLKLMCEEGVNIDGQNTLMSIQLALFQCLEAQKARQILRDELTPDIEKGINEIKKNGSANIGDEDFNPQWEEYLEKSGVQDKLHNFMELQKKGVDIMFDAFAHMTHLPFFTRKSNWFMPFTLEHPEVKKMIENSDKHREFIKILSKAGNMCSTDKFSNMLMLVFVQGAQMDQVAEALKANDVKEENVIEASPEEEVINYLHDLYRYYHIFKKARRDYNPFGRNLYFGKYQGLKDVVEDPNEMKMLAEFLLKNEKYENALTIFKSLQEKSISEEILQKYAYCIMKCDPEDPKYSDVLTLCNQYYPGNKWTIKHLADSLINSSSYNTAEIILRDGVKQFPDDVTILINLARCLIQQEKYEEAMRTLVKADLIRENSYRIIRHLAWCSFVLGNKENAEKYIQQVLSFKNADSLDWVNGGHIALLNGNLNLAIERYLNAEPDDVLFAFIDDNDKMLKSGISKEDITLTYELLNRKINS